MFSYHSRSRLSWPLAVGCLIFGPMLKTVSLRRSSTDFLHFGLFHEDFDKEEDIMGQNYNAEGNFFTTVDGVPVRKLFVGNLPIGFSAMQLHELLRLKFQPYGFLREINVIHRPPGKPFAFVLFFSPQESAKVLLLRGTIALGGRQLFISPADSWHQPHELPNGTIIWDRRKMEQMLPEAENGSDAEDGDNEDEDVDPVSIAVSADKDESSADASKDTDGETGDTKVEKKAQEEEECAINRLNDDCLCLIFEKMSIPDRMRAGSVCRRWRAQNSYFWRSFKKLDFTVEPFQDVSLTDNKLKYFLHHCVNVISLNLAQDTNVLTSESIIIVAKACKNLEELHMRSIILQRRCLALLANCCPKLKTFSMGDCSNVFDSEMMTLVKKSKNLENIALRYGSRTQGLWLAHLQAPIKSLMLEVYEFDPNSLITGISQIKSTLRQLNFVTCLRLRGKDIAKIVELCPDLTQFGLSGLMSSLDYQAIEPITRLSKLEVLDLEHNPYVCDRFMTSLVEGCQNLKQLNISGMDSYQLSERGLSLLVKLPALQTLSMAHVNVTDSVLKNLSKKLSMLKHLDVMGCQRVTDEGCIEILNNCSQLESLDVAGCQLVTNETITAAFNLLCGDPRRKLAIVCGSTQIKEEAWFVENEVSKRLKLDLKSTVGRTFHELMFEDFPDDEDYDPFDDDPNSSDPDVFDVFDMIHDHYEIYLGEHSDYDEDDDDDDDDNFRFVDWL